MRNENGNENVNENKNVQFRLKLDGQSYEFREKYFFNKLAN